MDSKQQPNSNGLVNGHPSNGIPATFTTESFPLEEVTHFSRSDHAKSSRFSEAGSVQVHNYSTAPTTSLSSMNASVSGVNHSSDSEPLSVGGVGVAVLAKATASGPGRPSYALNDSDDDIHSYPRAFGSSTSEDEDEITQYHRYDRITSKKEHTPGKTTSDTVPANGIPGQNIIRPAISDDNFPTILNSNAVVTKSDVTFAILTLFFTCLNFVVDATLIFWHYADGHAWYSAVTAIIMMLGACAMLHQFGIIDMERLRRIFDNAKRVRILANCLPTCGTMISSFYWVGTGLKAKTNQMFALQFFSHEEFLQNLLRIQSVFQAAPQATLQLLIFMETGHEMSLSKGIFLFINILTSLTIMTIGNLPNRTEEFDNALNPNVYKTTARLFIGLRMFSSFASRVMSIVYIVFGINCLMGKFSSVTTFESFLISFSIILVPRFLFTFSDYCYRRFRGGNPLKTANLSCCRIFVGYVATIFFPMSDPLWVFWYIWFETILFILFGNIVGWFNATECVTNLVNTIYTGTFIVLFIVIPIFLPFARATVKKRQMKRLENIFERGTTGMGNGSSRNGGPQRSQTPETSFSVTSDSRTDTLPNRELEV